MRPKRLKSLTYSDPKFTCSEPKTSDIDRPSFLAASRSMSSCSQVVLARKLANKSRSLGHSDAILDDVLTDCFQHIQTIVATILNHNFETACSSETFNRRRTENIDVGVLDFTLEDVLAILQRCRLPFDDVATRSWNSSSITYIEPKFGALAFSSNDWPASATVWSHAGNCCPPGVSIFAMIVLRSLQRCGIRKSHVEHQITFVLWRNKTGRCDRKQVPGSVNHTRHKAAVPQRCRAASSRPSARSRSWPG